MSDYPEMCPACHKADADLCFCSKAAQDAAWNSRAQPAAPADAAPSVAPEPPDVLCWACGIAINTSQPLPVAPEPVAWTLQSELDAAQTTCSAHLWFTNPCNSAWTALFTREKIAAHPPRAPLTEEQKRDLVKECDLDWQRGYMPLFEGDPTNRYAVLIEAVEAAHGIGGK